MQIVEFGALTPAARHELEGDESDPFDSAGVTMHFRPKTQHVALQDDRGRLIASTGMVLVVVEVGGTQFPVVGIGGVIVNAAHRGRGLAREVVESALGRAATLGPAFAFLFCHEDRAGLYRKLGFTDLAEPVTVLQPDGTAPMPPLAMWRPLHEGAVWPDGAVALPSLPF